jgi:hypothetical protein
MPRRLRAPRSTAHPAAHGMTPDAAGGPGPAWGLTAAAKRHGKPVTQAQQWGRRHAGRPRLCQGLHPRRTRLLGLEVREDVRTEPGVGAVRVSLFLG